MAELIALQDQITNLGNLIQELQSEFDKLREQMSGRSDASQPAAVPEAIDTSALEERLEALETKPDPSTEDLEKRLLALEVAAAKGKPGRKPKHVQEAIDAENEEAA